MRGGRKPNIGYRKAHTMNGCCDGLPIGAAFLGVQCFAQPIMCIGSGMDPMLESA
jgi:hypothetical protein